MRQTTHHLWYSCASRGIPWICSIVDVEPKSSLILVCWTRHVSRLLLVQFPPCSLSSPFLPLILSSHTLSSSFFLQFVSIVAFHIKRLLYNCRECMNDQWGWCHTIKKHRHSGCEVGMYGGKVDRQGPFHSRQETNLIVALSPFHLLLLPPRSSCTTSLALGF